MSWWGFIAFAILGLNNSILDKWYFAIPLFFLFIGWCVIVRVFADKYDKKYRSERH
jgi:hypothetical protein